VCPHRRQLMYTFPGSRARYRMVFHYVYLKLCVYPVSPFGFEDLSKYMIHGRGIDGSPSDSVVPGDDPANTMVLERQTFKRPVRFNSQRPGMGVSLIAAETSKTPFMAATSINVQLESRVKRTTLPVGGLHLLKSRHWLVEEVSGLEVPGHTSARTIRSLNSNVEMGMRECGRRDDRQQSFG